MDTESGTLNNGKAPSIDSPIYLFIQRCFNSSGLGAFCDVDTLLLNPLPLTKVIIGILILRPLKGGGAICKGSTLTPKP